jgi:hypothetical protein
MYLKFTGGYDEIPESMDRYLNMYGPHFNKKLCEEAVSRMYSDDDNLKPYTKEQVDDLLKSYSIKPKRGVMYDAVYVANMCLFDFMGKSVPDERHLAMFIKDMLDDPDAVDGYIFSRFYADCMYMNHPIEWEDML